MSPDRTDLVEEGAAPIFTCPSELLHKILSSVDPVDAFNFSLSCRSAMSFCNGNSSLYKALFLSLFDPATTIDHDATYDYEKNLKQRILARSIVNSSNESDLLQWYIPTATTLLDVATAPLPVQIEGPCLPSKNRLYFDTLFPRRVGSELHKLTPYQRWFLRDPSYAPVEYDVKTLVTSHQQQLAAHLSLLRTPVRNAMRFPAAKAAHRLSVYARRNVTQRSLWGPFTNDGTGRHDGTGKVDWIKLESIAQVMYRNISLAWYEWKSDAIVDDGMDALVGLPTGLDSTRSPRDQRDGRDWAGVESFPWVGTYGFLDYGSWSDLNFPRPGQPIDLALEEEAVGDCMSLNIKLLPEDDEDEEEHEMQFDALRPTRSTTRRAEIGLDEDIHSTSYAPATRQGPIREFKALIHSISPHAASPISAASAAQFKPLRFAGSFSSLSRTSLVGSDRSVTGVVRMLDDGSVHWRYVIRYDGEDRWLMNGVQVGGIGSQYGVVGNWTAIEHDRSSPSGPFWYWPSNPKAKYCASV